MKAKKIAAAMLSLVMVLSLVPAASFASTPDSGSSLQSIVESKKASTPSAVGTAASPVDLSTIYNDLLKDRDAATIRAQGNYLAVNGYCKETRSYGTGLSSDVLYYIGSGAQTNEFLTIVCAPDSVTTLDGAITFAQDNGWIAQMEKYGECLAVLPAPAAGWGTDAAADSAYIAASIPGFGEKAVGLYGCYYLVGYGQSADSLQLYAAAHPLAVSSQVYVDAADDVSTALNTAGQTVLGTWNNYDSKLESVPAADVAIPTWFIGTTAKANLAYWNAAKAADDITTSYSDVTIPVRQTADKGQTAADIIDFLNNYVRYESSTVYGNSIKERKVMEETDNVYTVDYDWTDPASGYTWNREYIVYVPDSAAELYPDGAPTVYALHGATNSANLFFNATSWAEIADEMGFIIVYLNGTVSTSNPSRCGWSTIAEAADTATRIPSATIPSDIDYIQDVISKVDSQFNTAGSERRYIYGNSAGSMNSNLCAQVISDSFTALGTTSGPIMGDNATVTSTYGPYVWDGVAGSNTSVMATPNTSVFPAYIVLGGYDHWPSALGYLDTAQLTKLDSGKYTDPYPGQKYASGRTQAEVEWPFRTQLYWTMRDGVTTFSDGTTYADILKAFADGTFTEDYYTSKIEQAFLKNMVVTNAFNIGTADAATGKVSSDVIANQGYTSENAVTAGLADEDTIDRYTTYTWYNDSDVPVFQWTANYGRSHEMTPDDEWLIAVDWFAHWTMKDGVRYYDNVAIDGSNAADTVFTDVSANDWFNSYVTYANANGLMVGTGSSTFTPGASASRAAVVTTLYRLAGSPSVTGSSSFTDLTDSWYQSAVIWASGNGITSGTSSSTFSPNDPVTREQLATFLYRYAAYMGYDTSASADLSAYTDAGAVDSWAMPAMVWVNDRNVLTGVSATELDPTGATSRSVLACVLTRFVRNAAYY